MTNLSFQTQDSLYDDWKVQGEDEPLELVCRRSQPAGEDTGSLLFIWSRILGPRHMFTTRSTKQTYQFLTAIK